MVVATSGIKQSSARVGVGVGVRDRLAAISSGLENGLILILVKHIPTSLSQIHLPKSFKPWCW
jgi:hypothetical protein